MQLDAARQHALTATAADFAVARTPPGWLFTDPDVLAAEQAAVFTGRWLAIGHRSLLPAAGDYITHDSAGLGIVVVRGDDGELRAFHNSCRHRGTRLLDGCGNTGALIRCPYHAWSYTLDGTLAATPVADALAVPADDPLSLARLELAEWSGWVFVALEPAGSVAAQFDDFPDLAHLGLGTLTTVTTREYTVSANWKLLVENFNECYHCASAHPALHRLSRGVGFPDYAHSGREFTGGPMSLEPGVTTLADPVRFFAPGLPGVRATDRAMVFYFTLYPNFLLTIAPDYVLVHHVWPLTATTSRVTTHWLVSPVQVDAAGDGIEPAVRLWHTTNLEDFALCENAQRGLAANGHRPGPYHGWEGCVHDFDRWVAGRLLACSSASGTSP